MAAADMLAKLKADLPCHHLSVMLAEGLATERGACVVLDSFLMLLKIFVKGILQPSEAQNLKNQSPNYKDRLLL